VSNSKGAPNPPFSLSEEVQRSSPESKIQNRAYPATSMLESLLFSCFAGKGLSSDSTPWWNKYRDEFFRTLSFGELETFDHPVACE
jgi:hypothetical protein